MQPKLKLHIGQQQLMTPQLLQSIRLLQLSSLELDQEIRQSLETNVMLEEVEAEAEEDDPLAASPEATAASEEQAEAVTGCDAGATDKVEADFDWSSAESWTGGEPAGDGEMSFESFVAAPQSFDARIRALEQLQMVVTDEHEQRLVCALLDHIDDAGYLATPLAEILEALPAEWETTLVALEAALTRVQSVEPTGFGARDLRECLCLQLADLPDATPGLWVAQELACHHLDRVAAGDVSSLAQDLDLHVDDVVAGIHLIRGLDPKPGSSLGAALEGVAPDILVYGAGTSWKVELNPETLPKVRVNRTYERMLAGQSHRQMKDQLQEARWLMRGLEMRHETLLKTARAVFEHQRGFLRKGEEGMAPLTLREVAQKIGMHESTVCRVVANKFVQTPWGLYALKAFFPSQIAGATGDTSGTAVKAMIRRLIDAENRAAPLCDGAIAALLARKGVRVARRTVAKYREGMKIASASERGVPRRALAGNTAP